MRSLKGFALASVAAGLLSGGTAHAGSSKLEELIRMYRERPSRLENNNTREAAKQARVFYEKVHSIVSSQGISSDETEVQGFHQNPGQEITQSRGQTSHNESDFGSKQNQTKPRHLGLPEPLGNNQDSRNARQNPPAGINQQMYQRFLTSPSKGLARRMYRDVRDNMGWGEYIDDHPFSNVNISNVNRAYASKSKVNALVFAAGLRYDVGDLASFYRPLSRSEAADRVVLESLKEDAKNGTEVGAQQFVVALETKVKMYSPKIARSPSSLNSGVRGLNPIVILSGGSPSSNSSALSGGQGHSRSSTQPLSRSKYSAHSSSSTTQSTQTVRPRPTPMTVPSIQYSPQPSSLPPIKITMPKPPILGVPSPQLVAPVKQVRPVPIASSNPATAQRVVSTPLPTPSQSPTIRPIIVPIIPPSISPISRPSPHAASSPSPYHVRTPPSVSPSPRLTPIKVPPIQHSSSTSPRVSPVPSARPSYLPSPAPSTVPASSIHPGIHSGSIHPGIKAPKSRTPIVQTPLSPTQKFVPGTGQSTVPKPVATQPQKTSVPKSVPIAAPVINWKHLQGVVNNPMYKGSIEDLFKYGFGLNKRERISQIRKLVEKDYGACAEQNTRLYGQLVSAIKKQDSSLIARFYNLKQSKKPVGAAKKPVVVKKSAINWKYLDSVLSNLEWEGSIDDLFQHGFGQSEVEDVEFSKSKRYKLIRKHVEKDYAGCKEQNVRLLKYFAGAISKRDEKKIVPIYNTKGVEKILQSQSNAKAKKTAKPAKPSKPESVFQTEKRNQAAYDTFLDRVLYQYPDSQGQTSKENVGNTKEPASGASPIRNQPCLVSGGRLDIPGLKAALSGKTHSNYATAKVRVTSIGVATEYSAKGVDAQRQGASRGASSRTNRLDIHSLGQSVKQGSDRRQGSYNSKSSSSVVSEQSYNSRMSNKTRLDVASLRESLQSTSGSKIDYAAPHREKQYQRRDDLSITQHSRNQVDSRSTQLSRNSQGSSRLEDSVSSRRQGSPIQCPGSQSMSPEEFRGVLIAVEKTLTRAYSHQLRGISKDIIDPLQAALIKYNPYKLRSNGKPDYTSSQLAEQIKDMIHHSVSKGPGGFSFHDHEVYHIASQIINDTYRNSVRLRMTFLNRYMVEWSSINEGRPSNDSVANLVKGFDAIRYSTRGDYTKQRDSNNLKSVLFGLLLW